VACFGSVQHALGMASLTLGEVDRAVGHLRAAIDDNLALGHWPAVTASRTRYAQALLLRDGESSDDARRELSIAATESAAMGIAPVGAASIGSPGGASAQPIGASCVREGRRWRVDLGPHSTVVGHSVGMLHLAVLLANPGFEVPARELVAGVAAFGSPAPPLAPQEAAQAMLDRTAVHGYRRRLAQLAADIDDFESADEPERAAQARAERNWIMAELSAATGIGGRARHFADNSERARLAVGKAIRRAVARIAENDARIGDHLRRAIHTGVRCSYQPF
jgi:hypothetical protein